MARPSRFSKAAAEPAPAPAPPVVVSKPTTAGIHSRTTLAKEGDADVERVVYCPLKRQTVGLAVCETCAQYERTDRDAEGPVIVCHPELDGAALERERLLLRFELSELALRIQVGELMSRAVTCVHPDAALEDVRRVLAETGGNCAPVVNDDGALVGIVTPRDLLTTPSAATAADVMSRVTLGIPEDAPLAHAMATMAQAGVLALPVLAGDGAVVGTIGALDALRFFAKRWGYEVEP